MAVAAPCILNTTSFSKNIPSVTPPRSGSVDRRSGDARILSNSSLAVNPASRKSADFLASRFAPSLALSAALREAQGASRQGAKAAENRQPPVKRPARFWTELRFVVSSCFLGVSCDILETCQRSPLQSQKRKQAKPGFLDRNDIAMSMTSAPLPGNAVESFPVATEGSGLSSSDAKKLAELQDRIIAFTSSIFRAPASLCSAVDLEYDEAYFAVRVTAAGSVEDILRMNNLWHREIVQHAGDFALKLRLALSIE